VVIPVQLFAQVADSPNQFALPGISHGRLWPLWENHFRHAARLCRFDTCKGFGGSGFTRFATQVQIHQRLVHLQAVFHERDLQLFGVQPGCGGFERSACLTIRREGRRAFAAALGKAVRGESAP